MTRYYRKAPFSKAIYARKDLIQNCARRRNISYPYTPANRGPRSSNVGNENAVDVYGPIMCKVSTIRANRNTYVTTCSTTLTNTILLCYNSKKMRPTAVPDTVLLFCSFVGETASLVVVE